MLTDAQIKQFQNIYKDCFGIEIDKKEALSKGMRLIQLMKIVYKKSELSNTKINKNENEIIAKKVQ